MCTVRSRPTTQPPSSNTAGHSIISISAFSAPLSHPPSLCPLLPLRQSKSPDDLHLRLWDAHKLVLFWFSFRATSLRSQGYHHVFECPFPFPQTVGCSPAPFFFLREETQIQTYPLFFCRNQSSVVCCSLPQSGTALTSPFPTPVSLVDHQRGNKSHGPS